MDANERIIRFIREEILFEDTTAQLTAETPLLDGVIDSLALMQLVAFLEEEFEVDVDDAEIVADNFRTVTTIGLLVDQKLGALKG